MVFVFSFQRTVRHGITIKIKVNVKGNGQECPFHTGRANSTSIAEPPAFVCDE